MHDIVKLGYIGLEEREIRVLKTIFILSPELKEHYALVSGKDLIEADLVLVNADSEKAVKTWQKLSALNKLTKPMAMSKEGNGIEASGMDPIKLPIRLPILIEALKNVVKGNTQFEATEKKSSHESSLRVLVVDDSFPVRKYMEQKLPLISNTPMVISFAASGEEALVKCKGREYDMVFLDVMMEGMDGYKVCKIIKSRYSSYVVMLTSKKSPFDKVRGTMSGCNAYVTKPPEDKRLVEEVNKCLKTRVKQSKKIQEI